MQVQMANWRLLGQEYLTALCSRRSQLLLGIFLIGAALMPLMLQKPPPELVQFLSQWLGPQQAADKLFLFAWCDLAMNKLAVMSALALSSGLIVSERATGLLPLLLSKPICASRLFLIKLLAAQAVFISLYGLISLLVLGFYPFFLPGFQASHFAVIVSVHVLAGTFAVAFSAWMAVQFQRRLSSMIASVFFLSLLIGTAFLGFYAPSLSWLSNLNPFYHGVVLISQLESLSVWLVLSRVLILLVLNFLVMGLGIWRIQALEQHEALL